MTLEDELSGTIQAAGAFLDAGDQLTGVLAAEPSAGRRIYLCAYSRAEGHAWLALDDGGKPVSDRALVREVVSIVSLCELAEETAGGGDVPALRAQLADLRETENPEGIEEAEAAAAALDAIMVPPPRVASLAYLDAIGTAAARLERALGETGASPFGAAMRSGADAVEQLADDVERTYKIP
jgi:hypothetical protein